METTQPYLEFSVPEVDRCSETLPLPGDRIGPATPEVIIEVSSDSGRGGHPTATNATAKAAAKHKWVPKLRDSQEGGGLAAAWATLDAIELKDEWKYPCATVREVPEFFRRQLQEAFYVATARI